jgi:hypothetical protein
MLNHQLLSIGVNLKSPQHQQPFSNENLIASYDLDFLNLLKQSLSSNTKHNTLCYFKVKENHGV